MTPLGRTNCSALTEALALLIGTRRDTLTSDFGDEVEWKVGKQIAFNVIPHIDVFMDGGDTKEEWKMAVETRKILNCDIAVTATCVRVPVFIGHAEAVNVEFARPLCEKQARAALQNAPGIVVLDERADGGYMTPLEGAGKDTVFVSRIRRDPTVSNGLNLWIVADNLRKGAALNAVQIAEELIQRW
jgi:aspartate-semialdehyde dehydrogenase